MKLCNSNTTSIRDAVELGCHTMQSVFNADDNGFPYLESVVLPHAYLALHERHGESHVPGRHLNELHTAEDALGVSVSELAIEMHTRATLFSNSGPLPLPVNRDRVGGPIANFTEHNVCERFHALYGLAKFRDAATTCEMTELSIAFIFKLWDPERGWDRKAFDKALAEFFTSRTMWAAWYA